jgi:hypothetical protein
MLTQKWTLTAWFRGFQSTLRANPLAQKIVKGIISLNLTANNSFYAPDNCRPFYAAISIKFDPFSQGDT